MNILELAAGVVGDHECAYGPADKNFINIADIWSVLLGTSVSPRQVCMCMVALKLARLAHDESHIDSWVDIAGYAQCAGEL